MKSKLFSLFLILGLGIFLVLVSSCPAIADLEEVKDYYNQERYVDATLELQNMAKKGIDFEDWELICWTAKVLDKLGNTVGAFYCSGWLYFANDSPHKDWDAKGYIFSENPNRSLFILMLLPFEKAQIPKNQLDGATAIAAFVEYQRRLNLVKKHGLTDQDIRAFNALEKRVDGIEDEVHPDVYDLVITTAKCRFERLVIEVDILKDQKSKRDLEDMVAALGVRVKTPEGKTEKIKIRDDAPIFEESNEALRGLVRARYNIIWICLENVEGKLQRSPDLLRLAGEALLEVGIYDKDHSAIKRALEILERSQRLKPSNSTQELIARAREALKVSK